MMRGTYGTVEDEDEVEVERQRHLSSERNFVPRRCVLIVAKTRKQYERQQKHYRDARGDAFCRRRGLARGRPKDERKNFARERRRCFCGVGIIVVVVFGAAEEDFQLGRNFGIYTFENCTRFTTTRGW